MKLWWALLSKRSLRVRLVKHMAFTTKSSTKRKRILTSTMAMRVTMHSFAQQMQNPRKFQQVAKALKDASDGSTMLSQAAFRRALRMCSIIFDEPSFDEAVGFCKTRDHGQISWLQFLMKFHQRRIHGPLREHGVRPSTSSTLRASKSGPL